jgi:ferrous iron transport protein B
VIGLGALGKKPQRVALCGNPNVGKTSLFNALTGLRQRVGNYPGITVERVEGTIPSPAGPISVVDLPGCYSLAPRSPDETVARDEITGRLPDRPAPDVVVVVADATNIERSLLLVTQTIDNGVPVIVALNQWDTALGSGLQIDVEGLAAALGVPVIPTCGRTGQGCDELVSAMIAGGARGTSLELDCPAPVMERADALAPRLEGRELGPGAGRRRAVMLLTSAVLAKEALEKLDAEGTDEARALAADVRSARKELEEAGIDTATCSTEARYAAIERMVQPLLTRPMELARWQARTDRFLTHPITGTASLIAIFLVIFMVVYSWSGPAIDFVDESLSALGGWLDGAVGGGLLGSFLADGIVAGLGAFLVFVPQIAMLFLLLEALEDSGYLARAAFLLDRLMGKFGLPGRSFLPLLSGFACAIPAIMATRTIENRRDRMITMAIAPLMSCQARLPVYAVVVGALFAASPAWVPSVVVISMYTVGVVFAGIVAVLLRKTVLPGTRSALLLELPPYRRPSTRSVITNTGRRTWSFIAGAGPVILVLMMVLWAALTFPQDVELSRDFDAETAVLEERLAAVPEGSPEAAEIEAQIDELGAIESSDRLRGSYMGRAGQILEPVIEPLGFDWKVGVAIIGSFAAREVFVPTLGVIYSVGDEADEEDEGLLASIRNDRWPDGRPVFTPLMGIALLIFYVIALQCVSTLGVLKRETNSWRWPVGLFVAYTLLAYVVSLAVFQVGGLLGFA